MLIVKNNFGLFPIKSILDVLWPPAFFGTRVKWLCVGGANAYITRRNPIDPYIFEIVNAQGIYFW